MKKAFSIFTNLLLLAVIGGVLVFFVAPRFGYSTGVEMKIVRSGSMEPAIHTGSIVVIVPAASYIVGDVVTFGADTRTSIPTTHRIVSTRVEAGALYFSTKGDANEDPDPSETPASNVIGKVLFSVPSAGYILAFAQTRLGFTLLIAVPALLIIVYEFLNIYGEIVATRKRKASFATAVAANGGEPMP